MTLKIFLFAIAFPLLLLSCGRPLTENEIAFTKRIHGDSVDTKRARFVNGSPASEFTFRRKPRPRETCRELILPPAKEAIITARPAAITLFHKVFFSDGWYSPDYLAGMPKQMDLVSAMLFAHEMTHVWQWQNRKQTGYHPLRAAAEHRVSKDPYLFDLKDSPEFLSYGYEQQGAIVEEYVCCRALAPTAARTKRLHKMLSGAFPVSDLPQTRESDVLLPWRNVELRGICD